MRILTIGILLILASCGPSNRSLPAVKSGSGSEPEVLAAESPAIVSVTMMKSPYVPVPEYQLIDGNYTFTELPLGYGVDAKAGKTPHYRTKNCVVLEPQVVEGRTTSGTFSIVVDAADIARSANPFRGAFEFDIFAKSGLPEIDGFIAETSKNLNRGSIAGLAGVISHTGSLVGAYHGQTWTLENCLNGDMDSNYYLDVVQFGLIYYVVAKINFKNQASVKDWESTNRESAMTSVFGSSNLDPSSVAKLLRQNGATLEVFVLQAGGSVEKTKEDLARLNCTTENIVACRKIYRTVSNSIVAQVPNKLTLTNWNKFGVIGFATKMFYRN